MTIDHAATSERIRSAHQRRVDAGVAEIANAYRLVHDEWDGMPGLIVERLVDHALVRYRDAAWATDAAVATSSDAFAKLGIEGAIWLFDAPAKDRTSASNARDEAIEQQLSARGFATPHEPFLGREYERSYELSTRAGFSCGLFFDMRECRHDLAARWTGRRVLNLFSYTCGFGVVLAAGNDVVNVDTSQPALDWGRRSYVANGLAAPDGAFVRKDAFAYLEGAARLGNRFDAIVLDPPSYSAGKKSRRGGARRFSLSDDFGELLALAVQALAPGGELFVSTNCESIDAARFDRELLHATRARGLRAQRSWGPAADFPAPSDRYHLKTTLLG